ncbi:MAG: phytanoyl-CoA dioxygenase family protein [Planctomycetota bacterium]|nr:phytanoyl-CoA dioxygenase family protein [Planctomycetota bacterium]
MPSSFQPQLDSFQTLGYCLFPRVVPASLLADLRRSAELAREIAHRLRGPDAQRLQPLSAHLAPADMRPLEDLYALPNLRAALAAILPPSHRLNVATIGVLFEPSQKPYTTHWHRDARDVKDPQRLAAWESTQNNPDCWNQMNLPLYEDTCTWVVPASHNRPDSPGEAAWLASQDLPDPRPAPTTDEEREHRSLDNVRAMPGGQRVVLDAGDLLLYRNTLWHLGNYTPYKRRATLHDNPMSPEALKLGGEALAKR